MNIQKSSLPVAMSIAAITGLIVYDTGIDKILVKALQSSSSSHVDHMFDHLQHHVANRHIHVDSYSGVNSQQPSTQPRKDNEHRIVASKRLGGNIFGDGYLWPST